MTGDAHEPDNLSADALGFFDERPPTPINCAFRWHEGRQQFYIDWDDEAGEFHSFQLTPSTPRRK